MDRGKRFRVSLIVGVLFFLGPVLLLFPWACNDEEGPSWDRCTTYIGTPAWSVEDLGLNAELNFAVPLLVVISGFVTWSIAGRSDDESRRE